MNDALIFINLEEYLPEPPTEVVIKRCGDIYGCIGVQRRERHQRISAGPPCAPDTRPLPHGFREAGAPGHMSDEWRS